MRPDGICADNHPFDDAVGITLDEASVLVSSGIAFITVAYDVLDIPFGVLAGAPFSTGEKASAPLL